MKITIETGDGDIRVSGMEGVPEEIAEKAARTGALNAGPAPSFLAGAPDSPAASPETSESAMDAGAAPQG